MPSRQTPFADFLSDLRAKAPEQCPHFLEQRFPHVLQRLSHLPAATDIATFFDALLQPPQGSAQGFPEAALQEIRSLRALWLARVDAADAVPDQQHIAPPAVTPPPGFSEPGKALRASLPLDEESFPFLLEHEFPHLLQEMLPLLGTPEFLSHLDLLLSPAQQARYAFSERAMLEILTLKAVHRAHHPASTAATPTALLAAPGATASTDGAANRQAGAHVEEHAATVFDRVQRW